MVDEASLEMLFSIFVPLGHSLRPVLLTGIESLLIGLPNLIRGGPSLLRVWNNGVIALFFRRCTFQSGFESGLGLGLGLSLALLGFQ